MSEIEKIQNFLKGKGLGFVVATDLSPGSETIALEVSRERMGDVASAKKTSLRQLRFLEKSIESIFKRRVIVIIREAQDLQDISIALRASLKKDAPESVLDVYVSFSSSDLAAVWLDVTVALSPSRLKELEEKTHQILANFNVKCTSFGVISQSLPAPSIPVILRSIKQISPATIEDIQSNLEMRGFSCPHDNWLSHKLDAVRKRGLVQRNQSGRFALTAQGLELVPTSRTGSSSDVERMLALGRRKRW